MDEEAIIERVEPESKINQKDWRFIFTYIAIFMIMIFGAVGLALEWKPDNAYYAGMISLAIGTILPSPKQKELH